MAKNNFSAIPSARRRRISPRPAAVLLPFIADCTYRRAVILHGDVCRVNDRPAELLISEQRRAESARLTPFPRKYFFAPPNPAPSNPLASLVFPTVYAPLPTPRRPLRLLLPRYFHILTRPARKEDGAIRRTAAGRGTGTKMADGAQILI